MDFVDIVNISALTNKLLVFLVNAVGLELILWSYAANWRFRSRKTFILGAIFILIWLDLDFVAVQAGDFFSLPAAGEVILWAFRSMYAALALFFGAFCYFSLNFPAANPLDKIKKQKSNLIIATSAFFFVASFGDSMVKGVIFNPELPIFSWIVAGSLFWFYVAAMFLFQWVSFFELVRNRQLAAFAEKETARLAVLGGAVFGFFNFLFNVIGPALGELWGHIGFFAVFADYAVAVLLAYLIYFAARDKLFGIKIILVEVFVGLMGASLLVMPIFVDLLWQRTLFIALFILFCVFGVILIKSTIKEYREKELLEQKVVQRTEELELAKNNLEEINSALEVRVQARTRELEKLNQTLEEKVTERTNDLESKIKDLEKFQRITVGRELKMIELKHEIERLRALAGKSGK